MADFDLESYLADGAKNVTAGILRASLSNPRESAYMARCAAAQRAAASRRQQSAAAGRHVPPFLIASITTRCNLHCAGCYARANHSCRDDEAAPGLLSGEQWGELFRQAAELGISVPEKLSVIGYDDTIAEYMTPPLSTLRLPLSEVAKAVLEILIDKSKGASQPSVGKTISLSPLYIERASVGKRKEMKSSC